MRSHTYMGICIYLRKKYPWTGTFINILCRCLDKSWSGWHVSFVTAISDLSTSYISVVSEFIHHEGLQTHYSGIRKRVMNRPKSTGSGWRDILRWDDTNFFTNSWIIRRKNPRDVRIRGEQSSPGRLVRHFKRRFTKLGTKVVFIFKYNYTKRRALHQAACYAHKVQKPYLTSDSCATTAHDDLLVSPNYGPGQFQFLFQLYYSTIGRAAWSSRFMYRERLGSYDVSQTGGWKPSSVLTKEETITEVISYRPSPQYHISHPILSKQLAMHRLVSIKFADWPHL